MSTIEQSIEVDVPVRVAYNQWTQFEEFPQFMEGIEQVQQLDDTRLLWTAQIAGQSREWEAKITEQEPDQRIAWTATEGAHNAGVVTFHRLAEGKSRVTLQLTIDPEGPIENVGAALGLVKHRVEGDMDRFKEFVESRGSQTGAWRGSVEQTNT